MISRMPFVVVAGLLAASATGDAGEPASRDATTIFGIRLGTPIAIPECPLVRPPSRPSPSPAWFATEPRQYPVLVFNVCYTQLALGEALAPDVRLGIRWPERSAPVRFLSVQLYDRSVECVHWTTDGVRSQSKDLQTLVERFGQPTEVTEPVVRNRQGQEVQTVAATWKVGDVTVTFSSAPSEIRKSDPYQLEVGWVDVETKKCRAKRHEK